MGRAPLLLPLTGLVCGILIAEFFPLLPVWALIILLLFGVSGAIWRPGTLPYLLIFFVVGWGVAEIQRPRPLAVTGLHYCSAEVLETRETAGNAMIGIATVDSVDGGAVTPFNVTVEIIGHRNVIRSGERIAFNSPLEPPAPEAEIEDVRPVDTAGRHYGVVGTVMVLPDSLKFQGDADGMRASLARLNRELGRRLSLSGLDDRAYGLIAAMLLGDRSAISPEERETFSAAGISHLLALSGTHVAVMLTLISIAMLPFAISRRKLPRDLLSIGFLWGYAALTGMSPSVVRAVVMATVFLFGRLLERESVPINSLCLAAILILIVNPADLFMPGFQMSFAAVAGIIIFYPLLNPISRRRHPVLYFLLSYPALSVAAMVLTSLISAWYFHVFPLYFLLTNLFAVPIVPFLLVGGVILLIVPGFWPAAEAVNGLCGLLDRIASRIAELPSAVVDDVYLPLWLTLILIGLIVILGVSLRCGRKAPVIAAVMMIAAAVAANRIAPPQFPRSETFELDGATVVREGDRVTVHVRWRNRAERDYLQARFQQRLRHYCARRGVKSFEMN